ncbi:class I SAM-dependent methyltransferase [Pontimicrobium sp. MEBiC01747]
MKNKVVEVFEGERATNYDSFITDFFPSYNFIMDNIPKLIEGSINNKESSRILVVGCGTGNETKRLLDYNKNWKIDACDPSKDMIEIAKRKLTGYTNLKLINTTVDAIDGTREYDIITLFLVLHFMPDNGEKKKLLTHIFKKLKKGGKFILLDICGTKKELKQNFALLTHLFPKDWSKEDIEYRKNRILNTINAVSEERTKKLLNKAGFKTVIKFHQSTICRGWVITKK